MNVTFLIGNGFDINAGMKTKFSDVYKDYLNETSVNPAVVDFKCRLKKDIEKDIDTWGDFEIAMAKDICNYETEQDYNDCIEDFRDYLEKYLNILEEQYTTLLKDRNINNSIIDELEESFKEYFCHNFPKIEYLISEMMKGKPLTISVISYNYTTLFDKAISVAVHNVTDYHNITNGHSNKTGIYPDFIHIHGDLREESVLGVDNEDQFKNAKFRITDLTRASFIKPYFNDRFNDKRVNDAKYAIDNSEIICVFGMSLGDSDLTWKECLVSWLKGNNNRQLFFYDYNCSSLEGKRNNKKMLIEDKAVKQLIEYLGIKEDEKYEQIKAQIHIPVGTNIFNLQSAIEIGKARSEEERIKNEALEKRRKELSNFTSPSTA